MASARREIRTYCPMSKSRCGVIATVDNGKFVGVRPDPDHPNRGICIKGTSAPAMVYDPLRLKYPMRRTRPKSQSDPGWERVGWDEALDEIAARLKDLKVSHGPESVFFYRAAAGGSASIEYEPWLIRFASVFGSPNTASTGHICNWHKDAGSAYTYGSGIPAPDFENTRAILLWGHNPSASWPTQAMRITAAVNRGARLIVIDPRPIPLTRRADLWLPVRPGTDGLLAVTFLHIMLEEELFDGDFLHQWTNGNLLISSATGAPITAAMAGSPTGQGYALWDEARGDVAFYDPQSLAIDPPDARPAFEGRFRIPIDGSGDVEARPVFDLLRERLRAFAPEATAQRTGISAELAREAVRLFARTKPGCYYSYNGIEQHATAMQTNRAICLFYALTGSLDRPGGNVRLPRPKVNDIEGGGLLPADQVKKRLGSSSRPLGPTATGKIQAYEAYRAILEGEPYPVRGFLSFGGDLIMANGDTARGRAAMQALDLYVQTEFYETPPSRYADFLLPASTAWECSNIRTSFEQRLETSMYMQYRPQVVPSQHESRPDLEIIFDLALRMGFTEEFFGGDLDRAFDYVLAPTGVTLAELKAHPGGMRVPGELHHEKHLQGGFRTPSRKVEIYSLAFQEKGYDPLPSWKAPEDHFSGETLARYPFTLMASKTISFCHGQHRSIPALRRQVPNPFAEISRRDADSLGILEGDRVRVETEVAAITVNATISDRLPDRIVHVMHGWWQGCPDLNLPAYDPFSDQGANVNLIIANDVIDPITGSVPHRSYPCRITLAGVGAPAG